MSIEKRASTRMPLSDQAEIHLPFGASVSCIIRDRSEGGFSLEVNSVLGIPDTFTLIVRRTGETFASRVVWKKPRNIGINTEPTA